jgi:hypothetical protein
MRRQQGGPFPNDKPRRRYRRGGIVVSVVGGMTVSTLADGSPHRNASRGGAGRGGGCRVVRRMVLGRLVVRARRGEAAPRSRMTSLDEELECST